MKIIRNQNVSPIAEIFDPEFVIENTGSLQTKSLSVSADAQHDHSTEAPQLGRGKRKRPEPLQKKSAKPGETIFFNPNVLNGLRRMGVLRSSNGKKSAATSSSSSKSLFERDESRDEILRKSALELSSTVVNIAGYSFPAITSKNELDKTAQVVVPLLIAEQPPYKQTAALQYAAAKYAGLGLRQSERLEKSK